MLSGVGHLFLQVSRGTPLTDTGAGGPAPPACPSPPLAPHLAVQQPDPMWGDAAEGGTLQLSPCPAPLLPAWSWGCGSGGSTSVRHLLLAPAPSCCLASPALPSAGLREAAAERRSAWPDVEGISLVLGHLMTGGREDWNELLPSSWCKMSADTLL